LISSGAVRAVLCKLELNKPRTPRLGVFGGVGTVSVGWDLNLSWDIRTIRWGCKLGMGGQTIGDSTEAVGGEAEAGSGAS
jgi:hypothetical protein